MKRVLLLCGALAMSSLASLAQTLPPYNVPVPLLPPALAPRPTAPAIPPVSQVPTPQPAVATPPAFQQSYAAIPAGILAFDSERKEFNAKSNGVTQADFAFSVTNITTTNVLITALRTTCGCTAAQLPTMPYSLAPGSNVPIKVTMNLAGKFGAVEKGVTVETSAGIKSLTVRSILPDMAVQPVSAPGGNEMGNRARNIQTALADRQAVFKGDCVRCHVEPGKGKTGHDLYVASCGICHEAEHRAAMVPDLKDTARIQSSRNEAYWRHWITTGRVGSLMPAFSAEQGGPLTAEQIDSLVAYLDKNMPREPKNTPGRPAFPSVPAPPKVVTPQP